MVATDLATLSGLLGRCGSWNRWGDGGCSRVLAIRWGSDRFFSDISTLGPVLKGYFGGSSVRLLRRPFDDAP
jgi:hypothetical protein